VKSTGGAANIDTEAESPVVKTFGEVFPDGSLIELVASTTGAQPNLLLLTGNTISIAPRRASYRIRENIDSRAGTDED
jgi:hypothetical protein